MVLNNSNKSSESQESSKIDVNGFYSILSNTEGYSDGIVKDMFEHKIYKALWLDQKKIIDAAYPLRNEDKDYVALKFSDRVHDKVRIIIDLYKNVQKWNATEEQVKAIIQKAMVDFKKEPHEESNASKKQGEADVDSDDKDPDQEEWDDGETESTEEKKKKPLTTSEKMAEMEEELKDAKTTLKDLAPDIVRVQLITNPTKIPKYLWRKIRNRKVNRKSRNPVDFVYALRMWGRKAFVPGSRKVENAYPLCKKLIQEQKRIIRENSGEWWFKPEYLNAQMRLKQLELVAPELKTLSVKKQTKFATSAKDFGSGYEF